MLYLADPRHLGMMMKNFRREEMDFTGEQHAHHKGVNPVVVPRFRPTAQLDLLACSQVGIELLI